MSALGLTPSTGYSKKQLPILVQAYMCLFALHLTVKTLWKFLEKNPLSLRAEKWDWAIIHLWFKSGLVRPSKKEKCFSSRLLWKRKEEPPFLSDGFFPWDGRSVYQNCCYYPLTINQFWPPDLFDQLFIFCWWQSIWKERKKGLPWYFAKFNVFWCEMFYFYT